jgi:hypothetical protein
MADENIPTNGDWKEYKRLVFFQLDGLTKLTSEMNDKIDVIKNDLTILKVKASIFGGIAGFIISIIVALISHKII